MTNGHMTIKRRMHVLIYWARQFEVCVVQMKVLSYFWKLGEEKNTVVLLKL
jgi:hypothetical protein